MRGLGIYAHTKGKHPHVVFVVLDGSAERPEVVRSATHTSRPGDDHPQQLRKIADDVDSLVTEFQPDVVVVRGPDYSKFGPSREVLRSKSLIDGVVLETARRRLPKVADLSGRDIGKACGSSKDEAEAEAARLVGDEAKEAGSAAMAALHWAAEG